MVKTKIIATVGPSCSTAEQLQMLIDNAADVFRMNFSHGRLEGHAEVLETLRSLGSGRDSAIAVMGDLCGPKIRCGTIEPSGQMLNVGDKVSIVRGSQIGSARRFGTNYEYFVDDVEPGDRIFIDDGQIELAVVDKTDSDLLCLVHAGGVMRSHKGINLPDTTVRISSITEYDWECVDWAIEHDLDFLALSFVRSAEEIVQLRNTLQKASAAIKVVAKIETPQAIEHLDEIVEAADAVLVARGDLGVEMDLAEVPLIQKQITRMCRDLGKPVIVATQMLQSMIESPVPTRAEVSDIANAIVDLTDAVMLSGETAVGKYPVNAVKTICRIASVTEAYLDKTQNVHPESAAPEELILTAAIAQSVARIVDVIDVEIVALWSQTGVSARLLSKARIDVPIVAFSSDLRMVRQMSLHYGVIPCYRPAPGDIEQFTGMVEQFLVDRGWAAAGRKIVLVTGQPPGSAGTTNAIVVHTINEV